MIESKVIYKRKFPQDEMVELDDEVLLSSPNEVKEHGSFDELMKQLYKDMVYVQLPGRQEKAKIFINQAIALSELYEMDIEIREHISHISVMYFFNCSACMKHLIEVIKEADDLAFFKDIDGFDIAMSLEFYTHAEYRNGRKIKP